MSVFCPKCQKRTYNEYVCDHCQYEIKKDYSVPKTKRAFSIKREFSKNPLLVVIAIGITILSLVGIYFAYDKYRERSETEKAFEYITGYDNVDDYLESDKTKINSKFTKDVEKQMIKAFDTQEKQFENMLKKQ